MLSSDSRRTKRLCEFGNCCTSMFNEIHFLFFFFFFLQFFFLLFFPIIFVASFRITFIILQVFYGQMVQLNQIIIIRQQVNRHQPNRHNNNSQQYLQYQHKNNQKVRLRIKLHQMSKDLMLICQVVLLECYLLLLFLYQVRSFFLKFKIPLNPIALYHC